MLFHSAQKETRKPKAANAMLQIHAARNPLIYAFRTALKSFGLGKDSRNPTEPIARTFAGEVFGLLVGRDETIILFIMFCAAETPTVPPINWKTAFQLGGLREIGEQAKNVRGSLQSIKATVTDISTRGEIDCATRTGS